jgi:hypothetical protein
MAVQFEPAMLDVYGEQSKIPRSAPNEAARVVWKPPLRVLTSGGEQ